MTNIDIYRIGRAAPITVEIDDKTVYFKKLQGEHHITSDFIHNSASALDVTIGDYITYPASGEWNTASGENYIINQIPSVVKINDSTFKYNIDFQANLYNLNKKLFKDGASGLIDFAYSGVPDDFLDKIVSNINEINSLWTADTISSISSGIDKTLQFTNESCLSALSKVAEAYKMEYDVNDKVISLQDSIAGASGYSFEYGRASGLYKLTREQVLNQNIITRCYGFGGLTNIPLTYRAPSGGTKRLTFNASGDGGFSYLDAPAATGLYGIIEGVFVDDNIFPQRTGTITSVNIYFNPIAQVDEITKSDTASGCTVGCNGYSYTMAWNVSPTITIEAFRLLHGNDFGAVTLARTTANKFTFTANVPGTAFAAASVDGDNTATNLIPNDDGSGGTEYSNNGYIEDTDLYNANPALDININNFKIAGQNPSIIFKTGDLSGVQCEIWKYEHLTQRMYINPFTDSDGNTLPNPTHLPASGDTYTLVNMELPDAYIVTAEAELQAATQKYLDENCAPHAIYTLDIDPKDAKLNSISLKAGDRVTIIDSALSINKLIRISSIEYPLVNPYKIKVILANPVVPYTLQERLVKAASIITKGALFSTSSPVKGMVPGANNAGAGYFLNAKGAWAIPGTVATFSSSPGSTTTIKEIINFTAVSAPAITNYQTNYAPTHGENPIVALRTIDADGNIIERNEQPKFTLASGLISSISWDLPGNETGIIILS
jgi:hypothetical protein